MRIANGQPTFQLYPQWLASEHGVFIDQRLKNRYETVAGAVAAQFNASDFWTSLPDQFREWAAEYRITTGYPLLETHTTRGLLIKPFPSYVHKTYRKNILLNGNWPDPPKDTGWILPPAIGPIHDVLRTLLVVKYLDGPSFLANKLTALAAEHGLSCRTDFEAREEGYYAAHAYFGGTFEVPAERWDTQEIFTEVELQITTQVQEVIRRLLHRYYEARRAHSSPDAQSPWQWDYQSDEFSANYLGHILHYVEGMIMDVRNRQSTEAQE